MKGKERKALQGSSLSKSNVRGSQGIYLERKLSSLTFEKSMKDNVFAISKILNVCLLRIKSSDKV